MPIYEYLCEKCDHEFEREQRITDPPVKTCPKCRSRRVTKLISRTSFVLKGGGWYNDLYSSAKKDAKPAPDAASGGDASTSTDSKSDAASKPAAAESKTDTKSEAGKGKAGKGKSKGKSAA